MGQLREQLVQNADELRGASLCDVLWSLGILDDLPADTFKQLASLLEQQPLRDFQPRVLSSTRNSCCNACLCRLHFQAGVLQHFSPCALLEDMLPPECLHAGLEWPVLHRHLTSASLSPCRTSGASMRCSG